jgi:hypothetical protein
MRNIKDVPEVTANGMARIEHLFSKLDEKAIQSNKCQKTVIKGRAITRLDGKGSLSSYVHGSRFGIKLVRGMAANESLAVFSTAPSGGGSSESPIVNPSLSSKSRTSLR